MNFIKFKILFFLFALILLVQSKHSFAQTSPATKDSTTSSAPIPAPVISSDTLSNKTDSLTKPATAPSPTGGNPAALIVKEDSLKKKQVWGYSAREIVSAFEENEMIVKEGEIITNVLKIVNKRKTSIRFTIDVVVPTLWRSLTSKTKGFEVEPNDSLFVPVMLLPNSMVGNANYLINAFVISEDDEQLANVYFVAAQKIISKWEVTSYPSRVIYFPYESDTTSFLINVNNLGNQDQILKMDFSTKTPNLQILNHNEKPLSNAEKLLKVKAQGGAEMPLLIKIASLKRNHKRIDIENHRPQSSKSSATYTVFVNATQTSNFINKPSSSMTKLTFIKLANEKQINDYAYAGIPLTISGDIYGLFGQNTTANLFAYGQTNLGPNRYVTYRYQLPASTDAINNFKFENGAPNLGYFFPKGNIQIGTVTGGISGGGGRGVSGAYKVSDRRIVSAFVATNPYFFHDIGQISYGISHSFSKGKIINSYQNSYSHQSDVKTKTNSDFLMNTMSFKLLQKHNFGLSASIGNTSYQNFGQTKNQLSFAGGLSYSSRFFDNKLGLTAGTRSFSNFFGNYLERGTNNNAIVNYRFPKKWFSTFSFSRGDKYPSFVDGTTGRIIALPHTLSENFNLAVNNPIALGGVSPSIFYNRNINNIFHTTTKGLNLYYSTNDQKNNYRFNISAKGMYTHILNFPNTKPYFAALVTNRIAYKTLSANLLYFYGPFSTGEQSLVLNNSNFQPQTFKASVTYSYAFKNDRFSAYLSSNFRYSNYLEKKSMSLMPMLYYFTATGWRFYVGLQYFVNSSLPTEGIATSSFSNRTPTNTDNDDTPITSQNFSVNAGFKKDLIIPVFGRKNFNIEFVSFLDLNGNGKKDGNEDPLKDVVIKFNEHEIQTNEKGTARLINTPVGKYKPSSFALKELDGWFSSSMDSMMVVKDQTVYIPFVRGIRIYGNVVLDKEKFTMIDEGFFDLSKIKITATDSLGKVYSILTGYDGSFMLYVPIGKYILTMNEGVLGQRFKLAQNNIPLVLNKDLENIYVSLYIIEKRRKVNIKKFSNNNGNFIKREEIPSDSLPKIPPIKETYRDTTKGKNQPDGLNNKNGNNNTPAKKSNDPDSKSDSGQPDGNQNPNEPNGGKKNKVNNEKGKEQGANKSVQADTAADPANPKYNPQQKDTPVPSRPDMVYYQVQPGNKLEDIAKSYKMTVDEIKKENELNENNVKPGQELKVKKIKKQKGVDYDLTTTTVLPGEDLYKIYKRVGMTVEELIQVNEMETDSIKPGQVLRVKKY